MPPINVDVMFRDFQRYTGDGLPNAPAGHPLPVGDPTSGVYNPTKRDFRELGHASLDAAVQAQGAAEAATAAMETPPDWLEGFCGHKVVLRTDTNPLPGRWAYV